MIINTCNVKRNLKYGLHIPTKATKIEETNVEFTTAKEKERKSRVAIPEEKCSREEELDETVSECSMEVDSI